MSQISSQWCEQNLPDVLVSKYWEVKRISANWKPFFQAETEIWWKFGADSEHRSRLSTNNILIDHAKNCICRNADTFSETINMNSLAKSASILI